MSKGPTESAAEYYERILKHGKTLSVDTWENAGYIAQQSQQPLSPPKGLGVGAQGLGAIGGPVTGKKVTIPRPPTKGHGYGNPEKIKADILERLTGQIANLCTKYNLSDKVEMETEVTMVEVNGTTTVTLTATIYFLPNPFIFVAMESYQEPPF